MIQIDAKICLVDSSLNEITEYVDVQLHEDACGNWTNKEQLTFASFKNPGKVATAIKVMFIRPQETIYVPLTRPIFLNLGDIATFDPYSLSGSDQPGIEVYETKDDEEEWPSIIS